MRRGEHPTESSCVSYFPQKATFGGWLCQYKTSTTTLSPSAINPGSRTNLLGSYICSLAGASV
jgi:hypothetical protein